MNLSSRCHHISAFAVGWHRSNGAKQCWNVLEVRHHFYATLYERGPHNAYATSQSSHVSTNSNQYTSTLYGTSSDKPRTSSEIRTKHFFPSNKLACFIKPLSTTSNCPSARVNIFFVASLYFSFHRAQSSGHRGTLASTVRHHKSVLKYQRALTKCSPFSVQLFASDRVRKDFLIDNT